MNVHFSERQRKLIGLIDELIARFDVEHAIRLAGPAAEAAQLAAKLGFRAPPVEFKGIRRPDYHPLLESNPHWESVLVLKVNDPFSQLIHSQINLGANEPASNPPRPQTTLSYPSDAAIANMKGLLKSWRRAVHRLTPQDVRPTKPSPLRSLPSPEMVYFLLALLEELRGPANLNARKAEEQRQFQEYISRPDVVRQIEKHFYENGKQYRIAAVLGKPFAANDEAKATPGMRWQDVKERLERLRDQGEPYPGQTSLARILGCSPSTVNAAFKNSAKLRNWMNNAGGDAPPRAEPLTEVVADRVAQSREPDPSDALPDEDVDKVMAQLIEQAETQEKREMLKTLNPEERRQMASLVLHQEQELRSESLDHGTKPAKSYRRV